MTNPSPHDRAMIVEMLRQFRAAQEVLLHGEGGSSNWGPSMPKTWTGEMKELERCLGLLAYRKPLLHRQVMSRYVDPVVSRRKMKGRLTRRGPVDEMLWPELGPCAEVRAFAKLAEYGSSNQYTCLVASWPSWVCKPTVELGVDFLVGSFTSRSAVGPALPPEMVAA